MVRDPLWVRLSLRAVAIGYVFLLVAWPVSLVVQNTFEDWLGPMLEALEDPLVINSLRLTAIVAGSAVVINLVFGVGMSLLLVRYEFPGKRALSAMIDVPLSVSPVVVGLFWKFMLDVQFGVVNSFLDSLGLGRVEWLTQQRLALLSLVIVDTWQWTPFIMLIALAGPSPV